LLKIVGQCIFLWIQRRREEAGSIGEKSRPADWNDLRSCFSESPKENIELANTSLAASDLVCTAVSHSAYDIENGASGGTWGKTPSNQSKLTSLPFQEVMMAGKYKFFKRGRLNRRKDPLSGLKTIYHHRSRLTDGVKNSQLVTFIPHLLDDKKFPVHENEMLCRWKPRE
jgi:hypothetical protein